MLGKRTVGYFPIMFTGDLAETASRALKIGKIVRLNGELWNRVYVNRKGVKTTEFRIIGKSIGGDK